MENIDHRVCGKNIVEALDNAFWYHIENSEVEFVGSGTVLKNFLIVSETCDYDFDIGVNLFLTKGRFINLVNAYISKILFLRFIEICRLALIKKNIVSFVFNSVESRDDLKRHVKGNCMLSLIFDGKNKTFHFVSRITYQGYISFLDAAIISFLAKSLGDSKDFRFVWFLFEHKVGFFKSIPYIMSKDSRVNKLKLLNTKTANSIKSRIQKVKSLESSKFGSTKRLIKNLRKLEMGDMPIYRPIVNIQDIDILEVLK